MRTKAQHKAKHCLRCRSLALEKSNYCARHQLTVRQRDQHRGEGFWPLISVVLGLIVALIVALLC